MGTYNVKTVVWLIFLSLIELPHTCRIVQGSAAG
jgi:hypothetical protein